MILGGTYVRSEHRGGDFAAVFAVADVRVDEVFAFDGLVFVSRSGRKDNKYSIQEEQHLRPQAGQRRNNKSPLLSANVT